jgi:niacin transporter
MIFMSTKKLVLTSLFVALAIVIPQAFHLVGGPAIGATLLPMHIPVFIGAMLLGPISGLIIAVIAVIVGVFLGMPPMLIASYMIFELSAYALISGYLYRIKNINMYISYFIAKLAGMSVALFVVYIMLDIIKVNAPMLTGSISMFAVGLPGIIIQIILIPSIIHLIKGSDIANELS